MPKNQQSAAPVEETKPPTELEQIHMTTNNMQNQVSCFFKYSIVLLISSQNFVFH